MSKKGEIIFYCEGCKYFERQHKEQFGDCKKENLVITNGDCR